MILNISIIIFQVLKQEEHLKEMEYSLEEMKADVHIKSRQLVDVQENLNDLKVDLAGIREQKNSAEKEVRYQLCDPSLSVFSGLVLTEKTTDLFLKCSDMAPLTLNRFHGWRMDWRSSR